MSEAIAVFTFKSLDHILRDGGTSSWVLVPGRARQCMYVVCTRNAKSRRSEGNEPHRSAFLVGKVSDVVVSPENPGRYLIRFDAYAEVSIPNSWRGDRNPVRYGAMAEFGIDPLHLTWQKLKPEHRSPTGEIGQSLSGDSNGAPLSIADAKTRLASTYRVPAEAIEITIRF